MARERATPGRPPGPRGADLLEVARSVFVEHGFAKTTMQEVASRAGISKTSLYAEHRSKDALFAAVILDWAERGRGAMRPSLDALLAAGSIEDGLLDLVHDVQAGVLHEGPLGIRRLVAAESTRFPDVAATYVAASWDANIDDLAGALAELGARGDLSPADPRTGAQQLTWMAVGGPLNAQTLGAPASSPEALDLLARSAVSAFLRAHGPPDATT